MKLKKIIFSVLIAGSVLTYQSCDKIEDFGDINQNPNATTQPVTAALLTQVLSGIGSNLAWDQGGLSTVAGLYSQLFSETQYTDASRYAKPTFNFSGYYTGALFDLQNIINNNTDPATAAQAANSGSNADQIAVARILKAYYLYFLTSLYGDIPYSAALKGSGDQVYDSQQAIFADLLNELEEAVGQFDNGALLRGDIMFGGDIDAWKRFANSARMLIALQMAKSDAGTGSAEFNAALNHPAGYISENSQNATIVYPGGAFNHPGYQYYNITQRDDYAVSETLTDVLSNFNDPRINEYGTSTKGFPYGLTRDDAVNWVGAGNSDFARVLHASNRTSSSPVVVLGAAHITLARAEAAQRGWTTENATTLYATGIEQSWAQWGLNTAGIGAYLAQAGVALTPATALEKIATQEWIAWFPIGWQAYNTWRRTGFPVLTPAPGTAAIPRRFPYGPDEYSYNLTNVQAAAATYTVGGVPDSQFGRLWFDN